MIKRKAGQSFPGGPGFALARRRPRPRLRVSRTSRVLAVASAAAWLLIAQVTDAFWPWFIFFLGVMPLGNELGRWLASPAPRGRTPEEHCEKTPEEHCE